MQHCAVLVTRRMSKCTKQDRGNRYKGKFSSNKSIKSVKKKVIQRNANFTEDVTVAADHISRSNITS